MEFRIFNRNLRRKQSGDVITYAENWYGAVKSIIHIFFLFIRCHNFPTVLAIFRRCLVRNKDRCLCKFRTEENKAQKLFSLLSKLSKEVSPQKPEPLLMHVLDLKRKLYKASGAIMPKCNCAISSHFSLLCPNFDLMHKFI